MRPPLTDRQVVLGAAIILLKSSMDSVGNLECILRILFIRWHLGSDGLGVPFVVTFYYDVANDPKPFCIFLVYFP